MPSQQPAEVNGDFVEQLLSLPDPEQQAEHLRQSGLLNAAGLDSLLDEAERLAGIHPGEAQQLADLCAGLASSAAAPAAVPRADYVRVRTHNENGEFEEGLRLAQKAYEEFEALGMSFEALRTNAGKMALLLELGRYHEALDAGQVVLNTLNDPGRFLARSTQQQADLLTALVQQNRGVCLEYMGDYEGAIDAYTVAEERYQKLGMPEHVGDIKTNRGAILSLLGRGEDALEAHKMAAELYKQTGDTTGHAIALHNIGEVHLRLADYVRSLSILEEARRLYGSQAELKHKHLLPLDMANGYLALNLYSEALAAYQEAESLLRASGMAHDRARALWGVGSVLVVRLELEEGGRALEEAAGLFEEAGNRPLLSGVLLERASLLEAGGDRQSALEAANRALELVAGEDWPVQQVYAHLRLADLLLPNAAEAEHHLLEARRVAEHLALPQLGYRLNERLGRLRRMQGRDKEARELLEAAVEGIERLRGNVTQDAMRASFLRDKTAAYEELLRLYLDRDGEDGARRAFALAERAKSRALVDLLAGVAKKDAPSADPELEDRLRTLQADLNAVYGQLLGAEEGARRVALSPLGTRAAELEDEISRLRLRAAASAAPSDALTSAAPVEDLLGTTPQDVTLVAYHTIGEEVLAFVVAGDDVRVVRALTTAPRVQQLLQKLTVQWDRLRTGGGFADRHAKLLERSARKVLGALYDELVAPLGELPNASPGDEATPAKLTVVPHGPLHQVPFHALFDGRRYLLERYEVSYAPSATAYALCQEKAPPGSREALVMGVEDPTIPNATAEARAVAGLLTGAEVRIGEGATAAALQETASGRGVLHLACHGLFRADNPMFSALKLHDGWLTAADAGRLDLDGALVALSACESGRSAVIGGDEILGLTRAFLGAGAATLAVSLWLVQDETTAELMGSWYGRLRDGTGRATALRAAQLQVKESHPHPYYWAPFVLIGRQR